VNRLRAAADVVGGIYEAALEPKQWSQALARVAAHFDAHRSVRFAVGSILGLALAACSVTAYEEPIKTFSAATTSADKALAGYSDVVVSQVRRVRREEAVAQPAGVRIAEGECQSDSSRCRILIYRNRDDPEPRPLVPEQPIPNLLRLMREIRTYADGLQAIVAADTKAQVEQSVDSVNGNLLNLAKIIGADAQSFGNFATPAGDAAQWLLGIYIDSVKLAALRAATGNADPLISLAVPFFDAAMREARNVTNASLAEAVSVRNDAFRQSRSDAALESLLQAAQAYDVALTASPESIFRQLSQSHSDLTRALNDDDVTWDRVFAGLESLKADADRLAGIVTALLAAAANEGS
jgi:hypothetical protein